MIKALRKADWFELVALLAVICYVGALLTMIVYAIVGTPNTPGYSIPIFVLIPTAILSLLVALHGKTRSDRKRYGYGDSWTVNKKAKDLLFSRLTHKQRLQWRIGHSFSEKMHGRTYVFDRSGYVNIYKGWSVFRHNVMRLHIWGVSHVQGATGTIRNRPVPGADIALTNLLLARYDLARLWFTACGSTTTHVYPSFAGKSHFFNYCIDKDCRFCLKRKLDTA